MSTVVNYDKDSLVKEFIIKAKDGRSLKTIRFTINGRYYSAFNFAGVSPSDKQKLSEFLSKNMLNLVETIYIKDGVETKVMGVEAPFEI